MSSPGSLFLTTTNRVLGLSVAAGYAFLGSICFIDPLKQASLVGLGPAPTDVKDTPDRAQANRRTKIAMYWIGARDLSFSAALFALYAEGRPREMGTVILAGIILCAVDVVSVWREKGAGMGMVLGIGAGFWGWVGWRLVNL